MYFCNVYCKLRIMLNKKVFLNGKCAVFEEMEVKGKNMLKNIIL